MFPRRPPFVVAASPLVLVAGFVTGLTLASTGCANDRAKSGCLVEATPITVPHRAAPMSTPLMLLPEARLDAVGDRFVLLGSDGTKVRWALLGRDGVVIGDEHELSLPVASAGPWLAAAGINAPADHLVVAYVDAATSSAAPGMVELTTVSVRIDNTGDVTPPLSSGAIPASAKVTMMSGRGGMHAGIAWAVPGRTAVSARVVGGDGVPVGADLDLGMVDDTDCLRFSPGKGDLTVSFVDISGTPPDPVFVATEIAADGATTTPLRLRLGKQAPGCVQMVPAGDVYGIAWHSFGLGTYFGVYDPSRPGFPSTPLLPDVRVSGTPPGVAALAWLGEDYAVVFGYPDGGDVWPVDANGRPRGWLPRFPSLAGHTATISAQPIGSTLYATYADYARAGDQTAGSRLLVKVSCPQGTAP